MLLGMQVPGTKTIHFWTSSESGIIGINLVSDEILCESMNSICQQNPHESHLRKLVAARVLHFFKFPPGEKKMQRTLVRTLPWCGRCASIWGVWIQAIGSSCLCFDCELICGLQNQPGHFLYSSPSKMLLFWEDAKFLGPLEKKNMEEHPCVVCIHVRFFTSYCRVQYNYT